MRGAKEFLAYVRATPDFINEAEGLGWAEVRRLAGALGYAFTREELDRALARALAEEASVPSPGDAGDREGADAR